LIDEGTHSLLTDKGELPIVEKDRIKPSITIIRGQTLSVISHRTWEIWDCGFVIEIEIDNFKGHRRFR
jgi:hypothetical protein